MTQSNTIVYRTPFGVPGGLARAAANAIIEPQAFNSSLPFTAYGVPGKIVSGLFVPIAGQNDVVYGFLHRPFPSQGANASDPLGTSVPRTTGECNVMTFGYMTVVCNAGTPAAGGTVYVWTAASSGAHVQGGIEAAATAGSTIAIPNCRFMGPADASGNCEIAFGA